MTRAFSVTLGTLLALIWAGPTGCRPHTTTTEASPPAATAASAGSVPPRQRSRPCCCTDHSKKPPGSTSGTPAKGPIARPACSGPARLREPSAWRFSVRIRTRQPAASQCDALGALGDLQHSGIRDATPGGNSPGCGTSGGARRRQGSNSWDRDNVGYRGPLPPPGSGAHRYFFRIYALDALLELQPAEATKATLWKAMQGHILAEGLLMGRYERPSR